MVAPARRAAVTTRSAKVVQVISQPAARASGPQISFSHGEPLVGRKQRRLAGMNADREHQPVGKPHGFADDVEMAVGDGIERSGKERNSWHGGGLARVRTEPQAASAARRT